MTLVCKQRNPFRPDLHLNREHDGASECTVSVISPFNKQFHLVGTTTVAQVEAFLRGMYARDAFPEWTITQHESVGSGMTPAEQDQFYGDEANHEACAEAAGQAEAE